ncbi:MAG TPA: YajQ family cyclic di-GMP-binding protein [Verrucomicrobiota bacterium]|nr:YajQ family cyclic di-GMP-binding protein [Verrucomicrobiales bacterium]HRI13784.1 YajQ family cyclic di-GMP-binding protein [Verrucomicrobiota bacterium]
MPSFDIVSQVNPMEIDNAFSQAKKELATRFDFKDSGAEIVLEKNEFKLRAADAFKIQQLSELLLGKLAKRGISLKNVDPGEADLSPLGHARQSIKIKQGIDGATAKQISQFIRQGGHKVTAAIQGDEVRVTGKSRDELQAVIAAVRAHDWPVALSFINFRD